MSNSSAPIQIQNIEFCRETAAKEGIKGHAASHRGVETAEPRDYFNLGQFDVKINGQAGTAVERNK
jgi:hypothetical protein